MYYAENENGKMHIHVDFADGKTVSDIVSPMEMDSTGFSLTVDKKQPLLHGECLFFFRREYLCLSEE